MNIIANGGIGFYKIYYEDNDNIVGIDNDKNYSWWKIIRFRNKENIIYKRIKVFEYNKHIG